MSLAVSGLNTLFTTKTVPLVLIPVITQVFPLLVPPEINILSPSLKPSSIKFVLGTVIVLPLFAIVISVRVTELYKLSAATVKVIPVALGSVDS